MSKQAEFAVILKMNPMFADLGSDELSRISNLCHTQHLTTGEVLFQKGAAGDALFGVRRGQIRIETGAPDGSRLTLNFMGPGDLFGEVAVLDGQNRTADATAGEASELFVRRRCAARGGSLCCFCLCFFLFVPPRARPKVRHQYHHAALPAHPLPERA